MFTVFSRLNRALKIVMLPKWNSPKHQILCSYYQLIWFKCKKRWLNKVIELLWVSKGSCRIGLIENSFKIITHIDDLTKLFPGHAVLVENASSS